MDVKTAFLNGELTDLTYCEPPPGYPGERGMVWKLHKALYGLKQAGLNWYDFLSAILIDFGFACMGSGEEGVKMVSAGDFLPDSIDFFPNLKFKIPHPCPELCINIT
jgi:hypothetical protein